jgi:hypothetical protein
MHRVRNSRVQGVHTQSQNIAWLDEVNHWCSKCRLTNFFSNGYETSVPSLFYLFFFSFYIFFPFFQCLFLPRFLSTFALYFSVLNLSSLIFPFLFPFPFSFNPWAILSHSLSSILFPVLIPYSFLLSVVYSNNTKIKSVSKDTFRVGRCLYLQCLRLQLTSPAVFSGI